MAESNQRYLSTLPTQSVTITNIWLGTSLVRINVYPLSLSLSLSLSLPSPPLPSPPLPSPPLPSPPLPSPPPPLPSPPLPSPPLPSPPLPYFETNARTVLINTTSNNNEFLFDRLALFQYSSDMSTTFITLTNVSCEVLSTARLTITVLRLTFLKRIFTVTFICAIYSKSTKDASY